MFRPASEIVPRGPFSLKGAAEFGSGPNAGRPPGFDGAMRLAFGVDGGSGYAGAVLRQEQPGGVVEVELQLREGADQHATLCQLARILSLDHDGEAFLTVGERDPVIGALQRAHPGQRPVSLALRGGRLVHHLRARRDARRRRAEGARTHRALLRDLRAADAQALRRARRALASVSHPATVMIRLAGDRGTAVPEVRDSRARAHTPAPLRRLVSSAITSRSA